MVYFEVAGAHRFSFPELGFHCSQNDATKVASLRIFNVKEKDRGQACILACRFYFGVKFYMDARSSETRPMRVCMTD